MRWSCMEQQPAAVASCMMLSTCRAARSQPAYTWPANSHQFSSDLSTCACVELYRKIKNCMCINYTGRLLSMDRRGSRASAINKVVDNGPLDRSLLWVTNSAHCNTKPARKPTSSNIFDEFLLQAHLVQTSLFSVIQNLCLELYTNINPAQENHGVIHRSSKLFRKIFACDLFQEWC